MKCAILGSGGGEGIDYGILGCNAVWSYKRLQMFRRNVIPPS